MNHCVDKFAYFGAKEKCNQCWDDILDFYRYDFFRKRCSQAYYRFVSSVGLA